MLVVEMNVRLHALGDPGGDEPFDRRLLLSSNSLFFAVMSLPLRGEEICQTTQPLTFSLDLPFLLTEAPQSVDISRYPRISNGLYGSRHHVVHLEVFAQQVQVVSSISSGDFRSGLCVKDVAIDGGVSSHGRIDGWLSVVPFYV